jgi:hypothetical protein
MIIVSSTKANTIESSVLRNSRGGFDFSSTILLLSLAFVVCWVFVFDCKEAYQILSENHNADLINKMAAPNTASTSRRHKATQITLLFRDIVVIIDVDRKHFDPASSSSSECE